MLATKFHGQMGVPVDAPMGTERRPQPAAATRAAGSSSEVDNSLRRLQTDWIDLYQVHRPEHRDRPRGDPLGALTDLQRAGKIRAFGCVDLPRPRDRRVAVGRPSGAAWAASSPSSRRTPSWSRGIEADLLPVTERYGMGVLPWSPLAGGWLSAASYRKNQESPRSSHRAEPGCRRATTCPNPANQAKLDAADALAELAEKAGLSLVHLALAFTLAHPAVTAPIIGPRTQEHLDSQLGAADVVLSSDVLDEIDKIVPPGTTLSDFDKGYVPPSLEDPFLRRRRTA